MARLADLPTEVELQIAAYISSKDLVSYARVGKAQAKVAREHLYYAPMIQQPDEGHRLIMLLRTLFAQPQRLNSIRSISLAVVNCTVPSDIISTADEAEAERIDWDMTSGRPDIVVDKVLDSPHCLEYRDIQEQLVFRLKRIMGTHVSEQHWFSDVVRWRSAALYGGLLRLLPNLERLELECYTKPHGGTYLSPDLTDVTFTRRLLGITPWHDDVDPVRFPTLSELYVKSGLMLNSTQLLPNLRTLRLGELTDLPHYDHPSLVHIQHLDACIFLWQGESPTWSFARLYRKDDDMSRVRNVNLRFRTQTVRGFCTFNYGIQSLAQLLDRLLVPKAVLETLSVEPIDHSELSHCRYPSHTEGLISDFSTFVHLRQLTLPFRPPTDTLEGKLPPLLEKLGLICTSGVHPTSVEHILQHRLDHGTFSRLDLFLLSEADVDINHEAWNPFKKAGVAVYIWVRQFTLLRGMPV